MTALTALWLPILVSAVVVFFVSFIIHTILPWHKNDYPALPREEAFMAAVRPLAIPPGDYMVPRAGSMEAMKTPEFAEKLAKGPVVVMTVLPNGPWTMTSNLVNWFLYSLVVSLFGAYLAGHFLGPDASYLSVFRVVGTVCFAGYSLALAQMSIWYKRSWAITAKSVIDGLVYAMMTAGVFGWLWPR